MFILDQFNVVLFVKEMEFYVYNYIVINFLHNVNIVRVFALRKQRNGWLLLHGVGI